MLHGFVVMVLLKILELFRIYIIPHFCIIIVFIYNHTDVIKILLYSGRAPRTRTEGFDEKLTVRHCNYNNNHNNKITTINL